jgi:hypothetical protein
MGATNTCSSPPSDSSFSRRTATPLPLARTLTGTVALSDRPTNRLHPLAQEPCKRPPDVRFIRVCRAPEGSCLLAWCMARTLFPSVQQCHSTSLNFERLTAHGDLVTEHKNLRIFRLCAAGQQSQPSHELPEDEIHQSSRHDRRSCPTTTVQRCRRSPQRITSSAPLGRRVPLLPYTLRVMGSLSPRHGNTRQSDPGLTPPPRHPSTQPPALAVRDGASLNICWVVAW